MNKTGDQKRRAISSASAANAQINFLNLLPWNAEALLCFTDTVVWGLDLDVFMTIVVLLTLVAAGVIAGIREFEAETLKSVVVATAVIDLVAVETVSFEVVATGVCRTLSTLLQKPSRRDRRSNQLDLRSDVVRAGEGSSVGVF